MLVVFASYANEDLHFRLTNILIIQREVIPVGLAWFLLTQQIQMHKIFRDLKYKYQKNCIV